MKKSQFVNLCLLHKLNKAVEKVTDVLWTRRRFWMALEAKCGFVGAG
jgi:hypothetical protein